MSGRQWLERKIAELRGLAPQLARKLNIKTSQMRRAQRWTPLKLITLAHWVVVYTKIIPKYYRKFYYVDLFAGPGLNYLEGNPPNIFLGSPLIAAHFAYRPFTKMYLVEKDETFAAILDTVMNAYFEMRRGTTLYDYTDNTVAGKPYMIFTKDANEVAKTIFKNESGSHYLVFIDPDGLDIHFSTIQTIVEATGGQCDLLLLFNTSSINRTIGGEREDSLTKFFGGEEWRRRNAEELLNLYKEKLKRLYSDIRNAKPYVESIEIDDPDIGWRYDMILLTREGDYTDVWKDLKDRIEKHRPQDVEIAKKTLDGLQTRLDNWAGPLLHYLDTT